jgi:ornithine carbamoyltransferase
VRGSLSGLKYVWIGDGNNMASSWLEAARLLRLHLVLACPTGFAPARSEIEQAERAGAQVTLVDSPQRACDGADVISTDVWASMGQESDAERRRRAFEGFGVTAKMVAEAAEDVVVLHCLPAHRGEEIEAEVIDGPRSFVWDEAEARLHTSKAVLAWVLGQA